MERQPARQEIVANPVVARPWVWAAMVSALLAAAGWFYLACQSNPQVAYLPAQPAGEWIVYPRAPWLRFYPAVQFDTTFERSFELTRVPASAELDLAAFRRCELLVNGVPVLDTGAEDRAWKTPTRLDIARALRPGANRLVAVVTSRGSHPALCLSLRLPGVELVTDSSWTASYSGATPRPASLASARRGLAQRGERFESGTGSVQARWLTLVLFALLSVGLCLALRRWWPALSPGEDPSRARRLALVLLGAVVVLWGARFVNNYPWLTRSMGFDAVAHHEYVAHIQSHGALPDASGGPQMHQPPLYYALASVVASVAGVDVSQGEGTSVLRLFSLLLGLVQIGFLYASLRLFLPERIGAQVVGLLFVASLPMHAFVFSYVTNETLTGALSAATIYLLLRVARRQSSLWMHAGLGLCLGLAAITKITALVLCPVVFLALAGAGFARTRWDLGKTILPILVTALVFAAVAGWHYIRAWVLYDTPFVRHIDLTDTIPRWREPSYHTYQGFVRFGQVLVEPFFAGFDSYLEAFYSTMWGDGRRAGGANSFVRPAWNYQLMAAGYVLALLPTFLVIVGATRSLVDFLRWPRVVSFVPVALAGVMVLALLRENLAHPYITVMKSWYTLPAMTAMAYFLAVGFEGLALARRWLRWALIAGLGAWALTSYASFWILGGSPEASMILGIDAVHRKDPQAALAPLREALRIDPQHADARYWLGRALRDLRRPEQAYQQFQRALQADPDHVLGRIGLASVSRTEPQARAAVRHLREAHRLAPDNLDVVAHLSFLLDRFEDVAQADMVSRTALHSARNTQDHLNQAVLCMNLGDPQRSLMHCMYVLEFGFYRDDTVAQVGPLMLKNVRDARQWDGPDQRAARASVLAAVAWLCATNLNPRVRAITAALPLAQEANRLTGKQDPWILRILAAAQADAGRFEAATQTANRALALVRESGFEVGEDVLSALLAAAGRREAYREPGRPLRALLSAR